jgi:hypothetical protein
VSTLTAIQEAAVAVERVEYEMAGLGHLPDPALIDPVIDCELLVTRAIIGNLVALGRVDPKMAFDDLETLTPSGIREEVHRNNR